MKKIYFFAAMVACATVSAQNVISFEASEGYSSGNINNQNGWTVTDTSDGPLTNQIVTDEVSKNGTHSFKNAHVAQYSDQWFPIFGAEKTITPASDYHNTTISYDFYSPTQLGSDFEFALYNINETTQEYDIVLALGFENRGFIYIYPELNLGGFTYAEQQWQTNTWYNVRIEIKEETIKFYLDNQLMLNVPNNSKVNIDGMTLLHNNFGGDAYYDNIKINESNMAVATVNKGKMSVYPNPVNNVLHVQIPAGQKIADISIHNLAGQKINVNASGNEINVKSLKAGAYILTVTDAKGVSYSSKFVKQ